MMIDHLISINRVSFSLLFTFYFRSLVKNSEHGEKKSKKLLLKKKDFNSEKKSFKRSHNNNNKKQKTKHRKTFLLL